MDNGLLRVPSDLFELVNDEAKLERLSQLEGWGPVSAQNLKTVTDRVAVEGVTFDKFLYSLSIRFIGAQTAALIANAYGRQAAFWVEVTDAAGLSDESLAFPTLRQEAEITKGVGPAVLSALSLFAKDYQLTQAGKDLSRRLKVLDPPSTTDAIGEGSERPWRGLSVVFTGSLPGNVSRIEAQKLAKELLGAKSTPTSLSKSTDWLVVGASGGKKFEQARQLGVPTMDAEDFLELVNNARKFR
jgi:DNA ligase (NAD+)